MTEPLLNKSPPLKRGLPVKAAFLLLIIAGVLLLNLPRFGCRMDIVLSGSMEPALKTGGLVITDTRKTTPEPGDIILFQNGNTKVMHRIIAENKEQYITKGDANNAADPQHVSKESVIGTVICTVPYLGYFVMLLKTKTVFTILFLMIIQETLLSVFQWKGERRDRCAEK